VIVTHLPKTYPSVLSSVRSNHDRHLVLASLSEFTLGDWARVADEAIDEYGDVVIGIYKGCVVSAFDITRSSRNEAGLVTFIGVPSVKWAWLIGSGEVPGGPWKRGEARPVRYFHSTEVFDQHQGLEKHAAGVPDPNDRMFEVAEQQAWKRRQVQQVVSLSASLIAQVEVALNPRGGINVTVPTGTRVTVIPRST
jgi:hypothetical protein